MREGSDSVSAGRTGLPNLFGTIVLHPQQVGDSGTLYHIKTTLIRY